MLNLNLIQSLKFSKQSLVLVILIGIFFRQWLFDRIRSFSSECYSTV